MSAVIVVISIILSIHPMLRMTCNWLTIRGMSYPRSVRTRIGDIDAVTTASWTITLILRMLLPILVMVVCNSLTLYSVYKSRRFRKNVASAPNNEKDKDKSSNVQCLQMTFGVVVAFLLTQSLRAYKYTQWSIDPLKYYYTLWGQVTRVASEFLASINTTVNFFIYAGLNRKFRSDVVDLFGCQHAAKSSAASGATKSTGATNT